MLIITYKKFLKVKMFYGWILTGYKGGWLEWLNVISFLFQSDPFEMMDSYHTWAIELLINSQVWDNQIYVLQTAVFILNRLLSDSS